MISISLTGHQHMQFVLVHVVKNTVVLDHIRSIWTRSSGLVKPKFNARLWSSVRMLCLFFLCILPVFFKVLSHIGLCPIQNLLSLFQRHFGPFSVLYLFFFKSYIFAIPVVPKIWFITTSAVISKYA
jgi:hypothetical protein